MLMKVCEPSDWRWYCTIRPVPSKVHTYVLCMEHMAGLIPVLLGKQTNRIIPQFQISLYNPKLTLVKSDSGSSAQVGECSRISFLISLTAMCIGITHYLLNLKFSNQF